MRNDMNRFLMKNARTVALLALLIPAAAQGADPGDNYCITPPFISGGIKPNLLLMIDSSASMYDMGYIAGSTSAAPTYSCNGIAQPVTQQYCFDNTYSDTQQYEGYFSKLDSAGALVYPVYQYSSAQGKFVEIDTGIPTNTGAGIYSTSYFHITMTGSGSTRAVSSFIASGRFLNWLAASKFDIQKKILTGGKYVSDASGGTLIGESRGCVGRRFVKTVPGVTGISFAVRGPTAVEPLYEASTQGGETKIEIFEGTYNETACTCAVANWTSGNFGQAQTNTADCLGATPADQALAALNHTQQLCWQIKNGANVTTLNTQALETSCLRLYDTTDPATLTNESNGNYICTSAATHATPTGIYAGTFASDTTGFLGTCTRGNSTNRFNDVSCVQRELLHYCMGVNFSEVTDPSSAVGTTGNIPAVIMDAGVRALGAPVGTFNGRVGVSSQPSGLISDFSGSIRFGAMTFFPFGSKSEWNTASAPTKISRLAFCSGRPTKVCTVGGTDCKTGEGSCEYASDKDAGVILAPIGTSVGNHTTANTVVKAIDDVVAKSWTPFAEAYYNAIAYFVKDATATTATLNATKFTPTAAAIQAPLADTDSYTNQNPIQFRCQQNNILLITDGSSTADRNATMRSKVTDSSDYFRDTSTKAAEDAVSGICGDYSGSPYLHDLSKFAYNRNIFDPSQLCRGTGAVACENAQTIRTHVVFNAPATTSTNVCDSYRQMSLTATNGGTTIKNPNNPIQLRADLKATLESIAAGAASGTAASILSNSEGSGANILQAVFYPKKVFADQTEAKWIGEMQNLWYFVDPQINRSTIREDTDQNNIFDLIPDKVVSFRFDSADNTTYAYVSQDQNGDGSGDTAEVKQDADAVKSIWRAGKKLWARPLTGTGARPRKIRTSIDGTSLIDFSSATFSGDSNVDNSTTLAPYLDVADGATATKLINYVHGVEQTGYRSRTVSIRETPTSTPVSGVWRLGDIISSTPRIQSNLKLNTYNLQAPSGYSDSSYQSYIGSEDYGERGMVYVGANDGMLHAFNFGKLDVTATGTQKATLEKLETTDPSLGEEMWAYIPKQALPYLKYYADPNYNHLYYIDGSTVLFDASIGAPSGISGCTDAAYYNCDRLNSVVDSDNNLDSTKNPWRSILIGGMGVGGASSSSCSDPATDNCVPTPRTDPADDSKGLGFSSYFALDVSNPKAPSLMWEFNHENLGFATTGPAIVRVGGKGKNGRWFAVFGSGPTGPVDTDGNQFQGRSNQRLKFFVVDLKTGELVGDPIDSGIDYAFAGSMIGASIDADRWNPSAAGNYQDDAIVVGFTKRSGTGASATWTDGGVLRILTNDDIDPSHWTVSKVVDGVGPVVTAISRLQDRKNMNLWYYFGTGRYYYRSGSNIDDYGSQRSLFGLKDPCYNTAAVPGNRLDPNCSTTIGADDITDQSTAISTTIGSGGWKISLDPSTTAFGAERVVSDVVTLTNGTVFATTFEPTSDACGFGGNSFLWALGYNTGGRPSDAALSGKALIQLSTGEFKEVDLAQAFGSGASRLMRRSSTPMTGKPPADAFPVVSKSANKPVKKILHIQER